MGYEWDIKKNKTNFEKHGISFEEARQIFDRDVFTWIDRRKNYNEMREISIGLLSDEFVIVVAHTDRNGNTRIISARTANRKERELYYDYIKKTH